MKHNIFTLLFCIISLSAAAQTAYNLDKMQREKLGRGVVAVRSDENHVLVSWRYLESDPEDTQFEILKNGVKIAQRGAKESTTYVDENPVTQAVTYSVRPVGGQTAGSWTVEPEIGRAHV